MIGYQLNLVLVWRTRKSKGYSQESIDTITTSITPSGATVDLSTSCNTIVVFCKAPWSLSFIIFSLAMIFIIAPRSMNVLWITLFYMFTSTTQLLRSKYFEEITLPRIRSDSCPSTLIGGACIFLLPGSLKHSSLIRLFYMGTYLMPWRRGILTHRFFNSHVSSTPSQVCCLIWTYLLE